MSTKNDTEFGTEVTTKCFMIRKIKYKYTFQTNFKLAFDIMISGLL